MQHTFERFLRSWATSCLPETLVRQSPIERPARRIEGNIKVYVRDIQCQGYSGINRVFNWLRIGHNAGIMQTL